jgi:DNA-binding beta-propeller fold protein YncE
MTTPMIFLTAWYFGRIFDRVDFAMVRRIGWLNLLVYPLLIAAVFQLITLQFTGRGPFQGVSQPQLENTYSWLAAAVVAIAVAWGLTLLRRVTGAQHSRQLFAVAAFSVLSLLTFRSAWVASFINYDLPTEFLVYAHATSGTKTVMNALEDLSKRTTDGMGIPFAYDHKLSWPGAWYFRHYTNATYMGDTPTLQAMEKALVILVGDENRNVVEPLLEDRYQRFDFKRMWWPMQDYFNLTAARVIDFFELQDDPNDPTDMPSAQMRHGVWDIFWMRDYTKFGEATRRTYTFNEWPVSENMYMYVRKDFAVQVWPYGIGDGSVTNPIAETEVSACVANWQEITASTVYDLSALGGALNMPIGVDVNGNRVLVAEDQGFRISEFGTEGGYIRSIGQRGPGDMEGPFFERPHSVEVASDGSIVVVDTWNYRIRVFNPDWEQIAIWGQPLTVGIGAPEEPRDGFWGPRDVAIGPDDLVYIADTGNKRVRVYTLEGEWVRDLGSGGSGEGQLNEPTGIAIHSDGRVFIADTWNRRISVFGPDGAWQAHYQVRAWYDEFGNRPYMALDEARNLLYVTDPDGGRVLVYSIEGECLGAFGRLNRENPGQSEFSTIGGIDVDAEGNVYVADLNKGRLLKFPPFPVVALETTSEDVPPVESAPLDIVPETTEEESPEQSPQG